MDNNNNKREKIIIFILGAVLIIAVLSIIAIFSSAIMRLLGFEYESVGGFILYFIIASVVSYPMNLVAGALPKALLNLDRITREMAVCMYVLLDTITTFFGFYIVDYLFGCSGGILPHIGYKRQYFATQRAMGGVISGRSTRVLLSRSKNLYMP